MTIKDLISKFENKEIRPIVAKICRCYLVVLVGMLVLSIFCFILYALCQIIGAWVIPVAVIFATMIIAIIFADLGGDSFD